MTLDRSQADLDRSQVDLDRSQVDLDRSQVGASQDVWYVVRISILLEIDRMETVRFGKAQHR